MIRHLSERLPLMIAPGCLNTRCQPIGARSVLSYLLEALDHPAAEGIHEIGGQDILSYREMMLRYARIRGLRRLILPVPWNLPGLSSRWIDLLTPIPARYARPLVESLRHEVEVETMWVSSLSSLTQNDPEADTLRSFEGMLLDSRCRRVQASAEAVFAAVCSLRGDGGWPTGNFLWQLRGLMDRLVGGTGLRRGRRRPRALRVGDHIDFRLVEESEAQPAVS